MAEQVSPSELDFGPELAEVRLCVECGQPEAEWLGTELWDDRLCSACALDLGKLLEAPL